MESSTLSSLGDEFLFEKGFESGEGEFGVEDSHGYNKEYN